MNENEKLAQIIQESQLKTDIIENIKSSKYFEFIDSGNNRVVAKPNKKSVVFKIENNPKKNVREFKIYKKSEDSLKTRLLPVNQKEKNYRWIKYPIVKFDVSEDEKLHFLNSLIEDYGIVPRDLISNEIGYLDGKIVITDYGYGFRSFENKIEHIDEIKS